MDPSPRPTYESPPAGPKPPAWERFVADRLAQVSPAGGLAMAVALLAAVGAWDAAITVLAGNDFVVTVLYLVPVSLAAWSAGARPGLAVAIAAALVEEAATWIGDPAVHDHPLRLLLAGLLELAVFAGAALIVAALRSHLDRERALARTDPVTGLANRRAFEEALEAERLLARRTGRPVSVAFLDLDGFKGVNDALGHEAGDRCLRLAAEAIRRAARETDVAARFGGDEFGVLLREADAEAGALVGERARVGIEAAAGREGFAVTASVGVATYLVAPDSIVAFLEAADGAMYEAKRMAKNTVQCVVIGP